MVYRSIGNTVLHRWTLLHYSTYYSGWAKIRKKSKIQGNQTCIICLKVQILPQMRNPERKNSKILLEFFMLFSYIATFFPFLAKCDYRQSGLYGKQPSVFGRKSSQGRKFITLLQFHASIAPIVFEVQVCKTLSSLGGFFGALKKVSLGTL